MATRGKLGNVTSVSPPLYLGFLGATQMTIFEEVARF
jgi:hypothetical protein